MESSFFETTFEDPPFRGFHFDSHVFGSFGVSLRDDAAANATDAAKNISIPHSGRTAVARPDLGSIDRS